VLKRGEKEDSMTSVATPTAAIETLAAVLEQLGGIAPDRVRFRPAPGTATEQVDPRTRTVEVFTTPDQSTLLHEAQTPDGGAVLAGFTLPLQEFFSELDLQGEG
jgi:hypothetical protein